MISDVELKQRAEAEISAALGDDACDLAVAVKDSVATLSGFVRRYSDACIAEHAVRKAGARGVANEIEVRLPLLDRRSDPDIARAALKALAAEELCSAAPRPACCARAGSRSSHSRRPPSTWTTRGTPSASPRRASFGV